MFKNCRTNTDQGNIGLGYAIAYFLSEGYTVLGPLTENQKYDLVIEKGSDLKKVQIKTSGHKVGKNKDKWCVSLSTTTGSQNTRKRLKFNNKKNFLFICIIK